MPNLLFFAADDLAHVNRLLALLIPGFDLPNLRRLANAGTEFDRAYCAVPICEPARCAVMTGFSPADTKSFDLTVGWKQIVHPRQLWIYRLREAGFWVGTTGKIFHGYVAEPKEVYDELYDSPPFVVGPYNPSSGGTDMGGMYGTVYDTDQDFYDKTRADEAIAMINARPAGRPWAIFCGFHHPHLPWVTPARVHAQIDINDVVVPASWGGGFETLPFVQEFITSGRLGFASTDPASWTAEQSLYVRQTIHNYAAGALWMDEQLGRVLDALDASPHATDTIVTFYSDHGYHLSDHDRWHKFTLYEQAALAPMVVKAPGQTPRKVLTPVSHVDLGATILDLCGLPVPAGFRGVSLKPWIDGQTPAARAIPTFWYGSASIAKGDKRLTVYQDGTAELFNLATDPWAKNNLAASDPDFAALREECIQTAGDWGMLIVEEAIDTSRPSNFQSFLGTAITDPRFATSFASLGDMHPKGRSPGWQRMYSTVYDADPAKVIKIPPHIEDFSFLGGVKSQTRIEGNALDNRIRMMEPYWATLTLDLGEGDDEIVGDVGQSRIVAYGGPGNDILRAGSWVGNKLYGGAGHDTLIGNSNNDLLDGGAGNDSITGGGGADTIYGGTGANVLKGDAGADLIISEGQDTITGGADADTFRLLRCGLVRTITDLGSTDVIDLSDWAPIQPVTVTQVGPDAHITAGVERVICAGVTATAARARITGATING